MWHLSIPSCSQLKMLRSALRKPQAEGYAEQVFFPPFPSLLFVSQPADTVLLKNKLNTPRWSRNLTLFLWKQIGKTSWIFKVYHSEVQSPWGCWMLPPKTEGRQRVQIHSEVINSKSYILGFPGGAVVKNPPARKVKLGRSKRVAWTYIHDQM